MDHLGVPFTAEEIYDTVNKIAVQNDGMICYPDFKRVFSGGEEDLETRNLGEDSGFLEEVPPHKIPEINEVNSKESAVTLEVTNEMLNAFKVKVKPVTDMRPVWNSQNTQSKVQIRIWAPSLDTGWSGASHAYY